MLNPGCVARIGALLTLMLCVESGCSTHAPGVVPPGTTSTHRTITSPAPIQDTDIDKNIDATVPASERTVIRDVMLKLPVEARQNVIYFGNDGKIYTNHPSLRLEIQTLRPEPDAPGTFVSTSGRLVAAPPVTPRPTRADTAHRFLGEPEATTSTGPYRRLYSDANLNYTYASASIAPGACPLTNSPSVGPAGDVGYIYTGGWSNSGSDSADAGFQYSAARDQFNLFIKVVSTGSAAQVDAVNWPCTGLHSIHFLVQSGQLSTFATGYDSWGNVNSRTLVETPANFSDWSNGGEIMKVMVSIAQIPALTGDNGVAEDGYSFGISNGQPDLQLYNVAWGYCYSNGTCNVPHQVLDPSFFQSVPDVQQVQTTLVNPNNFYTETDGIQLDALTASAPGASGSSTYTDSVYRCQTQNDPRARNRSYYIDVRGTATSKIFATPSNIKAPTSANHEIAISLSSTFGTTVAALLDPSGKMVSSTRIPSGHSGGLTYFSPGARSGQYKFVVGGVSPASAYGYGCYLVRKTTAVASSWTGSYSYYL